MSEFRIPWLMLAIGIPAVAAILLVRVKDSDRAKQLCLSALGLSLAATVAEWIDFARLGANQAHDRWDLIGWLCGFEVLVVDRFSAPLLGLHALYTVLLVLATMRTKIGRVSFSQLLASHVVHQTIFSINHPVILIVLLAINLLFPWLELRARRKNPRVFVLHALLIWICIALGYALAWACPPEWPLSWVGYGLLVVGLMARCWTIPFHCGLVDLHERLGFGSAILFSAVMVGPYLAIRLGLPVLPDWSMLVLAFFGLLTAIYAASMALVQTEVRRVYCYLFLGHGSLILVGLETGTPAGVAAALGLWLGSSIAVVGLGLTLRSIESRFGRLSLADFRGYYEHVPQLAGLFVVTGLALVGFPGTVGFVSTELLIDGLISRSPIAGTVLVLAAALSSIAVLRMYFRLFTGHRHQTTVSLQARWSERVAVLTLIMLLIGGSLVPQLFIESRLEAARQLLSLRPSHGSEVSHSTTDPRPGSEAKSGELSETHPTTPSTDQHPTSEVP